MFNNMSKFAVNSQKKQNKSKFVPWKCLHYARYGPTKPYCYELYGYPKLSISPKFNHGVNKSWKPKHNNICHIAHTIFRTSRNWYFIVDAQDT